MERETRFELATPTLARLCSTAELFPLSGTPGRIRTSDHLVRSQVLYPAELRVPYEKELYSVKNLSQYFFVKKINFIKQIPFIVNISNAICLYHFSLYVSRLRSNSSNCCIITDIVTKHQ